MHSLSPICPVEASGPGALAGFESRCTCGLVLRSSLREALRADRVAHAVWHERQAARTARTKRDFVALGPEAALRRAASSTR